MAELDDDRLVLASSRLLLMRDSGYNVWGGEGANMCECVSKRNVEKYFFAWRLPHLLRLAAAGGAERVRGIVVTVEAAVQLLRCCGEVIQPHLFPRDASAALRVHAVPTALLIT